MNILLGKRRFHMGIAIVLVGAALWLIINASKNSETPVVTAEVSRGTVTELVSVSGFVEAQNAANLVFPVTGIVDEVLVRDGDEVQQGDVLVSLQRNALLADRQDAYAAYLRAEADRDELIAGPTNEARSVTATEVAIAEENLAQTQREEMEKVNNARRTLLSSGLTALSLDGDEDATAPTVSGTYTCEKEGSYTIDVFRSGALSGFSFRVSGLETGTFTAYTDQPGTFGNCGLYLTFTAGDAYANSSWRIKVPNTQSASYISNLNAYELALEQAENNIRSAEQALELATGQATVENAAPRTEALTRANANVASAAARLSAIDAGLNDRIIRAPFDGSITNIDVLPGETVGTNPIVTVLANDTFKMTVRIPEIDITKLDIDQSANIIFDARPNDVIVSRVNFISPIATEIDGVAYFEATMAFDTPPAWLRSGLNADVDIVVDQATDVLRLPKRFVTINDDGTGTVLRHNPDTPSRDSVPTTVDILFEGNDGFVAIEGLPEGTTVSAP